MTRAFVRILWPVYFLFVLSALSPHAMAQELQGAAAAIEAMKTAQPAKPIAPDPKSPMALLRFDLERAPERMKNLPPQEAARAWLALVDRFAALKNTPDAEGSRRPVGFSDVIAALPPPSAWEALATQVQARYTRAGANKTVLDTSLLLLVHLPQGDAAAQWKDIAALEALVPKTGDNAAQLAYPLLSLMQSMADRSADPARIIRSVDLQLAMYQNEGGYGRSGPGNQFTMPDLVTLIGPQKAEMLIRKTLLTPGVEITVPVGNETRNLARRLALEMVAKLKTPQWTLTHSVESTSAMLFAAWTNGFPESAPLPNRRSWRRSARCGWETSLPALWRRLTT
jgi:hypothetical protein